MWNNNTAAPTTGSVPGIQALQISRPLGRTIITEPARTTLGDPHHTADEEHPLMRHSLVPGQCPAARLGTRTWQDQEQAFIWLTTRTAGGSFQRGGAPGQRAKHFGLLGRKWLSIRLKLEQRSAALVADLFPRHWVQPIPLNSVASSQKNSHEQTGWLATQKTLRQTFHVHALRA
jgi:hypothetical protein